MKRYSLLFFALLFIVLVGCKGDRKGIPFDEGTIIYSLKFIGNQQSTINTNILPDKLNIKFKNSNTVSRIEGKSGSVSLTYINNVDDSICIVLVNIWNKKLVYQDSLSNLNTPNVYRGMQNINIEKTNETVRYKGYLCKKAIAYYGTSKDNHFDILYTNDITINKPNANTPFSSIDGVMLKFSVMFPKYTIDICAESIEPSTISSQEFTTPKGYEKVSRRTIEDLISLIQ